MTHVRVTQTVVDHLRNLRTQARQRLGFKLILISDSGAFARNHAPLEESSLFDCYQRMGVDFGVVNDVLGNARQTVRNCERAMREYLKRNRRFRLIGVAQGKHIDDYLECYEALLRRGFTHIAVGGLLQKKPRSVRFTQVQSQEFMRNLLETIRREFRPAWLFVLGVYHPRRHSLLDELGVWGSDYKGWLLKYPSLHQGIMTLSRVMVLDHFSTKEIRRIKDARNKILIYRSSNPSTRKRLARELAESHRKLWRSESIAAQLCRRDLKKQDRRIIKAVFWQDSSNRRRTGILFHLRNEVFPLVAEPRKGLAPRSLFKG